MLMARKAVLEWRTFNIWSKQILRINKDLLSRAVVEEFKSDNKLEILSDNIGWLEEVARRVNPLYKFDRLEDELTGRLVRYYSAVRAFHACRPLDVSAYYEQGLLPLDPRRAASDFKRHFLCEDFPELDESDINSVIEETTLETIEGHVYFNLDERLLIEQCGHYLLYGSEYVVGLANGLRRTGSSNYRQSLKNIGTPTMFICDVPWGLISDGTGGSLNSV
jgi:hypothetical protein